MNILKSALLGIGLLAIAGSQTLAAPLDNAAAYYEFENNLNNTVTGGVSGNASVIANAPAYTASSGVVGTGLQFTASSGQSIRSPFSTSNLGDNFAVSAWYWQSTATTGQRNFVFEADNNFDVSYGNTANDGTTFAHYVGQATSGSSITSKGAWHHVLHTFSSSAGTTTLNAYVDGVLVNTNTAPTVNVDFTNINIGTHRDQARFWDGFIDEFAIFNSSLTAAQAGAITYAGVNGQSLSQLSNVDGVTLSGWAVDNFTPVAGAGNDLGDGGFSGPYFRTQGAGDNTITITMSDLPEHNVVNLGMVLAQLDSLDPDRDGDRFIVRLDGNEILSVGVGYGTSVNSAFTDEVVFDVQINGQSVADSVITDLETLGGVNIFSDANFLEHMYDLGLLDAFQNIPHTSDSLILEIIGRQNQASGEFFGVDNITISTALVPEPASLALWGVLGALLLLGRRKLRRLK